MKIIGYIPALILGILCFFGIASGIAFGILTFTGFFDPLVGG